MGEGVTSMFQYLYSRGKELLALNEQGAGWAPESVGMLWRREKVLVHAGKLSPFPWFFSP
jgi:hypothetical protein